MNSTKLNIPKKIKVGFQKRQGTYTGRLAYVTYFGPKGGLRKERSWEGWRDSKIDPEEYDNEPTDGFVLNKKVGDYRSRYGGRSAWIRIYDPRGFEFEISVQNLLFLLEECNCIKGKGLEGEFIYAWDGKNLVLLPVGCVEHKESTEYTALQGKRVYKKDMIEGCLYKTHENETVMYLGRHKWYEKGYDWLAGSYSSGLVHRLNEMKFHVFYDVENDSYMTEKGFTKLAIRLDDKPAANFADEYTKFKNSKSASPFAKGVIKKTILYPSKWEWNQKPSFLKKNGKLYKAEIRKAYNRDTRNYDGGFHMNVAVNPVEFLDDCIKVPRADNNRYYHLNRDAPVSKETLKSMDFYDIFIEAENGAQIQI
jgi:hypothetical protein